MSQNGCWNSSYHAQFLLNMEGKKEKKRGKGNTNYIVLFLLLLLLGFFIRKAKDSSKTSTIALQMLLN